MKNICQSCGMPLAKDPMGGGTRADGSKSSRYCSFCYQDGAFIQPTMTATEMQRFCIGKLGEMGVPRPLGWLLTRNIPTLERWQQPAP